MHQESTVLAQEFLRHCGEFRLDGLPTEDRHPLTTRLSVVAEQDLAAAVRLLQAVDRGVIPPLAAAMRSDPYERLARAMADRLRAGGRILISGCGATGRLAILIEAMWRSAMPRLGMHALRDRVHALMTGGDYALIKSVESFEDQAAFGAHQLGELHPGPQDLLVAISEGGETSSVIGTALAAADAGAIVFFLCNNPLELLRRRFERCRRIIDDPRITCLGISTGAMAVAGSTRMQATTSELLVTVSALERALDQLSGRDSPEGAWYAETFGRMLDALGSADSVAAIATLAQRESTVYRGGGAVTYYADSLMLDILTDTTERSPTFSTPPFRRDGDQRSPRSWSFAKNPLFTTPAAWDRLLGRRPRCLEWPAELYRTLRAPAEICATPPAIGMAEMLRFRIGNEADPSRFTSGLDTAIILESCMDVDREAFHAACTTAISPGIPREQMGIGIATRGRRSEQTLLVGAIPDTPLALFHRLTAKLVMNTVSTTARAAYGRIDGNVMVHVAISNKKLIDRGIRIIAMTTGLGYEDACRLLFQALDDPQRLAGREVVSPVAHALHLHARTPVVADAG